MIEVEKRDGSIVTFDSSKIFSAISKDFDSLGMEKDDSIINLLVLRATADFQSKVKDNRIRQRCHMLDISQIVSVRWFVDRIKNYLVRGLRLDKPIYSIKYNAAWRQAA